MKSGPFWIKNLACIPHIICWYVWWQKKWKLLLFRWLFKADSVLTPAAARDFKQQEIWAHLIKIYECKMFGLFVCAFVWPSLKLVKYWVMKSGPFLIKNLAYIPPYYLLVGLVTKEVKIAPVLVAFQSRLSQLQAAARDFEQQEIWACLLNINVWFFVCGFVWSLSGMFWQKKGI